MPKLSLTFNGQHSELYIAVENAGKKDIENMIWKNWSLKVNEYSLTYLDQDGDEIAAEIEQDFEVATSTLVSEDCDELTYTVNLEQEAQPQFLANSDKSQAQQSNFKKPGKIEQNQNISYDYEQTETVVQNYTKQSIQQDLMAKKEIKQQSSLNIINFGVLQNQKQDYDTKQQQKKKQLTYTELMKAFKDLKRIKQETESKQNFQDLLDRQDQDSIQVSNSKKPVQDNCQQTEQTYLKNLQENNPGQNLQQIIRAQVLKMVPQLKLLILGKKQENEKKQKYPVLQCDRCSEVLSIPCFYDNKSKIYFCQHCEARDQGLNPLVKIRNFKNLKECLQVNIFSFLPSEMKQSPSNIEEYLVEVRDAFNAAIQDKFNEQIRKEKRVVSQNNRKDNIWDII